MNNYDFLRVYDINNKLRIGSNYDGGYIIIDNLCNYDVLLSCGISNDDTFEHYFVNKHNTKCFAFDGTINNIPHEHPNINFIKTNIGITSNTTDMKYLINKYNNIFLKMDIEGSEYDWINNLSNIEINKFKQICIEFHLDHECSNHISLSNKLKAIKRIADTHYCVHFHGNNWRSTTLIGEKIINIGTSKNNTKIIKLDKEYPSNTKITFDYKSQFSEQFSYNIDKNKLKITRTDKNCGWEHEYKCVINGIQIPKVFECTYIHKSLVKELALNSKPIPDLLLDTPNTGMWRPPTDEFENNRKANKILPDIYLNTYPFVNNKMKDIFTSIYEKNHWGNNRSVEYSGSSGLGSSKEYNIHYIPYLRKLIKDFNIKTVVDLGCGDFRIGELLYNDLEIAYTGYDAYKKVIEYHKNKYSASKYSFVHLDIFEEKEKIIGGDLCILKDVLQHWPLKSIYCFLDYLTSSYKFKYIIIINCCCDAKDNIDCVTGSFRPLSCNFLPLKKYNIKKLANYKTKEISIIKIMIPKIIHQTYKNYDLPETYKMCQTEIQKLHPDFEYRFYTDDDMDRLMKTEFPEYYDKFNELPRMIMKIDMFRYFLMYKYGGLYADMDYLMFKPFDILNEKIVIPTNRDLDNNRLTSLGNCIFASVPNHLFWKSLIDTLFTIDRKNLPFSGFDNVIKSTGPMFVFNMYNEYLNKHDINVPERMLFHPPTKNNHQYIEQLKEKGCYGMHICTGLWLNDKL